jgi:molybdopterin molybdotransferase
MQQSASSRSAGTLTGSDEDSLAVADAQRIILNQVQPIVATETLALKLALGRVLADDLVSPMNVPAADNSAMDGYALRSIDLQAAKPGSTVTLKIAGHAFAGHAFDGTVNAGHCVRIMTGAVIPQGCDAVLPQELAQRLNDHTVELPAQSGQPGLNIRRAGEDLLLGQAALKQGRLLSPADLGLIASLGLAEVVVKRKLRVAHFSTGDELQSAGQPLDEGHVFDSNRYTLHGMLVRAGFEPIDLGLVKDDPAAIEAALLQACAQADAVITSGGVSAGDADYTRQMMARLGDVAFWKIAMRPGRPLAFGTLDVNGKRAILFGLPGNPVATMVSFYFFARPALYALAGAQAPELTTVRAISAADIPKKLGRTEFQRGQLTRSSSGELGVRTTGAQGSGILSSMTEADCMIILSNDQDTVRTGDMVDVVLFDGLI